MKVSIIVPVIDKYKKFSQDAIDSLKQSIYCESIVFDTFYGVGASSNIGVKEAAGEYVMRLDCDDKLHPLACEIMAGWLNRNPDTAAVYSDYWEMDEDGNVGDVITQTVPPHPGCMMVRKEIFEKVGGFNESLKRQEGTDFYYRLTKEHQVDHINLPLWYYRRHDGQMSNAHNEVIKARHEVKENHNVQTEKILAIIPARGGSKGIPRKNLVELNGIPLVAHAIRMAKSSRHDIFIIVSTEDEEIAEVAENEGVEVYPREQEYAGDDVDLVTLAKHIMEKRGAVDDIVITIQPTAPFTPVSALDNALDRMFGNPKLDAVVSMSEVYAKHPWRLYYQVYLQEKNDTDKLYMPFFPDQAEKYLQRQDRPKAYQFSGGFYIRRRHLLENWKGDDFALGNWEGELVPQNAGIDIDTRFDLWLAQAITNHQEEI